MVLMIDNYDSFTYNLVQYCGELGERVEVWRNDAITVAEIRARQPDHIILSPGPCTPNEAGVSLAVVRELAGVVPILGVCLGHQTIGQAFGGKIIHAREVMHGKTSLIHHRNSDLFQGLGNPYTATRYHSLVIEQASFPACLEITAWLDDGTVMGLRHRVHPVEGIQFHPESILTPEGMELLANWLRSVASRC